MSLREWSKVGRGAAKYQLKKISVLYYTSPDCDKPQPK